MDNLYHRALNMVCTPASKWPSLALLTADAFLCILIIWKIPCSTPPPPPSRSFPHFPFCPYPRPSPPPLQPFHLLFSSTKRHKKQKKKHKRG